MGIKYLPLIVFIVYCAAGFPVIYIKTHIKIKTMNEIIRGTIFCWQLIIISFLSNKEVKSNINNYLQSNSLGSSEALEYLVNNSIKAAQYLRSDYLTGMDRGLKSDEIKKRLDKIDKVITLI